MHMLNLDVFSKGKRTSQSYLRGPVWCGGNRGAGRVHINPNTPALESQSRCVHVTWDYLSADCFWFIITLICRKENWPNQ